MKSLYLSVSLLALSAALPAFADPLPQDCTDRLQKIVSSLPGSGQPSYVDISNVQKGADVSLPSNGETSSPYTAQLKYGAFSGTANVSDTAGSCYIVSISLSQDLSQNPESSSDCSTQILTFAQQVPGDDGTDSVNATLANLKTSPEEGTPSDSTVDVTVKDQSVTFAGSGKYRNDTSGSCYLTSIDVSLKADPAPAPAPAPATDSPQQ